MKRMLSYIFVLIVCTVGKSQDTISITHPHCGQKSKTIGENVFAAAQQMPQYPGGLKAVNQFIISHVQASKADIQAHKPIGVSFVVDTLGQVVNVCIGKSKPEPPPDPLTPLEQEVLRVVQLLPKWTPGQQGRRKVPVGFTILVKFNQ